MAPDLPKAALLLGACAVGWRCCGCSSAPAAAAPPAAAVQSHAAAGQPEPEPTPKPTPEPEPAQKLTKKQKKAAAAAAAARAAGHTGPLNSKGQPLGKATPCGGTVSCAGCGAPFASRNAMFRHIRATGCGGEQVQRVERYIVLYGYVGTAYYGSQRNAKEDEARCPTLEGTLLAAIEAVTKNNAVLFWPMVLS